MCPVSAAYYTAFIHSFSLLPIWLQTLIAIVSSQFLLGGSLPWSRSITRGFELSAAHPVDPDDLLTVMKYLVERKSQFPCGILFLHLAQKQVQIWGRRISSIVGFRSPNFAQRNILVYWNRINRHFGFWKKKYRELEFWPLGNESSPFCRTEWFHIHVKMAFFHLSVWLIGQGGWKFSHSHWFDSLQFEAQTEKCSSAGNCKFCNFFIFFKKMNFNPSFNQTYLKASFHCFRVLANAM